MKKIFEYSDYAEFLTDWIKSRPKGGHGVKIRMAKYLGCIPAQITKVLKKDIHLTLDQAAKAITFLELSNFEGQYFLGLVELARAGSNELREIILERLSEIKKKVISPEGISKAKKYNLSEEELKTYYENWYYTAIEVLAQIPKYQTVSAICDYLNLPKSKALNILNFLVEKGIVNKEGSKYIRDLSIRFDDFEPGSIFFKARAINWRNQALASLDQKEENNLNLNLVFTLAEKDIPRLKDSLIEKAKELYKSVEDSPKEEIRCLCIDFFKVK